MAMNNHTRLDQVKSALRTHIAQHKLAPGDRLPSESELAKTLGISRNTLREAYVALENEGFIIRRHGIGTFIAKPPRIKDSLNAFSSFAEMIQAAGYTPNFQTLSMETLSAPPDVGEQLQISPGKEVFFIKRLVFADEHPAIYLNDYFAPQVQASTPRWNTFDGNVVQFLFATLETPLYQLHSRIRAVALIDETAQILHQPVSSPAIGVWSTIYTIKHEPVAFSKLWFNSNIIELETIRILHKTG